MSDPAKHHRPCPDCGGEGFIRLQEETVKRTGCTAALCKTCEGTGLVPPKDNEQEGNHES